VTFDPFGDFETRGYLRNSQQEKDPAIVRRLEHASFTTGIDVAFEQLAKKKPLTYTDVLSTHRILFDAVYPWAGQDRANTSLRANPCAPTILLRAARFAGLIPNSPTKQDALRSLGGGGLSECATLLRAARFAGFPHP
jgi:fido (protein-threonine AMPylation protein)